MNSLARRSLSAVVWNFAGGGGRALAQLFIQIALARILGPEVFGQYAIVLAVLGIGWLIADSGFGAALIQKSQIDDYDVGYALGWVLIVAIITGGGTALLAQQLAEMFNNQNLATVFKATGLLILLQAVSNVPMSLMRRELDAKRLQIIQLSSYVIGFGIVGINLALHGWGIWSLVISFLSQTLISLIAMYSCVRHTLHPRWSGDSGLRSFGLRVVGTNVANWAIENLDRILVGKIWGIPSLGAYTVTLNLSRAPVSMLVGSVQSVIFASGAKVKEDLSKLRRGYLALMAAIMVFVLPFFILLGFASQTVIDIVYGDRWAEASPLFCAFAVSTPFYIITAITGPILWSVGQVGKELRIQLFVLFVMLAGLWLVSDFPLSFAIWLIPALYLIRAVMMMHALSVQIKLTLHDILQAMRGGLILTAIAIGSWFIFGLIDMSGNVFNALRLVFCFFVCAVSLYWSRGWLLGLEAKAFLLNRKTDSSVVRLMLKMAGLN